MDLTPVSGLSSSDCSKSTIGGWEHVLINPWNTEIHSKIHECIIHKKIIKWRYYPGNRPQSLIF